jgi:hypothetical protein
MHGKRIAQVFECASGDRNCIEADLRLIGAAAASVVSRRPLESMYFIRVNVAFGAAPLSGTSHLYFNKHKDIVLPGDDVDLAAALRRTPVARHHHEAIAAQVPVGQILAAPSGVTVSAEP